MSTLLPELSGMDFKEIIDYLSNMGPYNFDFEAEVERLYKQLQEYRSSRLEPRLTGPFFDKPWDKI